MNRLGTSVEARSSTDSRASALWIALVAGLIVAGSYGYACAAPLAAVSALAALSMGWRNAIALAVVAWLANQAVGFLLLDYPHSLETYFWGMAIGVAAVIAVLAARTMVQTGLPALASVPLAFLSAFAAYELVLYLAGVAVSYSGDSFSFSIVGQIFTINAVAFAGLLLIHRIAVACALLPPAPAVAATSV